MKKLIIIGLVFLFAFPHCKKDENGGGPVRFNSLEEEIDYLVGQYLKVGFVVGIIDKEQQKRVFAYGEKERGYGVPPDENTVFEIGSINKSFTCLISIDWMLKGKLTNDTAQAYLPEELVSLPLKDSIPVLLHQLLTHTSGIPRSAVSDGYDLPPGYSTQNPYANYTTNYVYRYLNEYCQLEFVPGTDWTYSNTGMGLMGHILGLVDSSSYETVLQREVFDKLGMTNSSLFLNEQQKRNYALGYDKLYHELPEFTTQDIMQGAGFIKSSVSDMFTYLEAQMGLITSPMSESMAYCQQPQLELDYWGWQCFGWYKKTLDDDQQITYCGGNTIGFGSYLGFNKTLGTGVILWYNADFDDGANLALGPAILEAINKY
jgi:CubicO group peptidase (beta-lactamase class C family)